MAKKIFGNWYSLSEDLRRRLDKISPSFCELRDYGAWASGHADRYESEAIVVLRRHAVLTSDIVMPHIKSIMEAGIKVAIFPVGMMTVDIVFYSVYKRLKGKVR